MTAFFLVLALLPQESDEGPLLRPGEVVEGALERGASIVSTEVLSARPDIQHPVVGRAHSLAVDEPGVYHVDLRSDVFDAYLVLRDEAGEVLGEDDDGLLGLHSRLVVQLDPARPVVIEACALHGGWGSYELAVRAGAPVPLQGLGRIQAEIEDARRRVRALEARDGPESADVAFALTGLAVKLQEQGSRYEEVRRLLEQALAISERTLGPEHLDVAARLDDLAQLLAVLDRADEALPLAERGLAIREQALGPEHRLVGSSLNNLAVILVFLQRPDEARPLAERALAIFEESYGPTHPSYAIGLNTMAVVSGAQGLPEEAVVWNDRALIIKEESLGPEHPEVATSLYNMADSLRALGRTEAARPLFERGLAICERALGPRHPKVAAGLDGLAELLLLQGRYGEARPLAERALAIQEETLGPEHVSMARNRLAMVLYEQGLYEEARPLWERELALREAAHGPVHPSVATSLNNLASLHMKQGEHEEELPLRERALAIWEATLGPEHPDTAGGLFNLATLLVALGRPEEARPLYERSLTIREEVLGRDSLAVAESLNNLARLLPYEEALPLRERTLAIFQQTLGHEHPLVTMAHCNLAKSLLDLGREDEALARLRETESARADYLARELAAATDAERYRYLQTHFYQLELFLSTGLANPGHALEAYEALLRWKGQVLRLSRLGRARLRAGFDPASLARIDRLQEVSSELSRAASDLQRGEDVLDPERVAALVAERRELERELGSGRPVALPAAPAWSELRDALPEDAALVDLFIQELYTPASWREGTLVERGAWHTPRVIAWVTLRDAERPLPVDLGPLGGIQAGIGRSLDRSVARRGRPLGGPLVVDPADDLRALLWEPLQPHVDGVATVFVSSDGVLGTLPFEILRNEDGRYLVEERGFVYLTDPTELAAIARRLPGRGRGQLVVVGGVDYAQPKDEVADWEPLPATRDEAAKVIARHARAFADGGRTLLAGEEAVEERLKAELPGAAVLHLATHGYFRSAGLPSEAEVARQAGEQEQSRAVTGHLVSHAPGLLSGLVCAGVNRGLPEDGDDGYLTAEEVGWLDLSGCELVVLSACDTGLGRPQSGEGLIGLRRAFLQAGARTVISSLWSVPDQATAELMDLFYRNLWSRGLGVHDALRAAQLEMIDRNRAHHDGDARPETWGAFVVDGDWR